MDEGDEFGEYEDLREDINILVMDQSKDHRSDVEQLIATRDLYAGVDDYSIATNKFVKAINDEIKLLEEEHSIIEMRV